MPIAHTCKSQQSLFRTRKRHHDKERIPGKPEKLIQKMRPLTC